MQGELQRIIDAVAAQVGRPALLEDRRHRVVVYSEHTGLMDRVRLASILRRDTTPDVLAWFRKAGIMDARETVRIPACPELDLLPRVCVPIRHQDLLLGFVWFIDADGSMPDVDLDATGLVAELTLALYRENLLGELASRRETEAARSLLSESAETRDAAVQALMVEGVIGGDGPATALVAQLVTPHGRFPDEVARIALEQALVTTRRWLGARESVHIVQNDHGVLLLPGGRLGGRPSPEVAAKHLDDGLRHAIRGLDSVERTVVGIGQPRARLAEAVESYREALLAAKVGAQLTTLGQVISWSTLGIYRVLSRMDRQHLDMSGVHPGLERLLRTLPSSDIAAASR